MSSKTPATDHDVIVRLLDDCWPGARKCAAKKLAAAGLLLSGLNNNQPAMVEVMAEIDKALPRPRINALATTIEEIVAKHTKKKH